MCRVEEPGNLAAVSHQATAHPIWDSAIAAHPRGHVLWASL